MRPVTVPAAQAPAAAPELAGEIAAHPLWCHTLELGHGIVTRGWFDLRGIVDRMPWPDVRGKRCPDVGTWDSFLAFELERRGAAAVAATDIADPRGWDWPVGERETGPAAIAAMAGEHNGRGFELAKRALGSRVERVELSVDDLTPERVGGFDVVVCGSPLCTCATRSVRSRRSLASATVASSPPSRSTRRSALCGASDPPPAFARATTASGGSPTAPGIWRCEGAFFTQGKPWWTTLPFGVAHQGMWKAPLYPAWVGLNYESSTRRRWRSRSRSRHCC